jgi:hypothetical protein
LLWVGLGCGGLLLLSLIGGGIAVYLTKRAAESGLAALSAAAAPLAPPTTPGAAPPAAPNDASGSPVDGACAKAAACCRKIMQKSNAGAQAEAGCLAMKQLRESDCQQPFQAYQQSARLLGVSCD